MNFNRINPRFLSNPHFWVAIVYLFLTLLMLHPLVKGMSILLPDVGDSFHNIWTWGDNLNRFKEGRSFFDANILYPNKQAGSFQELQVLNTILFAFVYLPSKNPVLAYNVILLAAFLLTALFTYSIAFTLSNHPGLAFLAGIATAFVPFRFVHLPHVQLLTFFWVLMPLLFLILYLRKPRGWLLASFFVSYTLQIISVGYNTVFLIIFSWGYLLAHLVLSDDGKRWSCQRSIILVVLLVAFVFALPAYIPYLTAATQGYSRGIGELKIYGLDLALFFSAPGRNLLYGEITAGLRSFRPDGDISSVFPGFTFLTLFVLTFAYVWRGKLWRKEDHQRTEIVYFLLAASLFLGLALGPIIKLRGEDILLSPMFLAFKLVPAFSATRYLPAYIQPALFAMSILVSIILARYAIFQRSWISGAIVLVLALLMSLEFRTSVGTSTPIPTGSDIPPVYQWLKDQPRYPLIELPMPPRVDSNANYWMDQFSYMYYSIYHGQRMANGITGFFPQEYFAIIKAAASFPSRGFIRRMRDVGIKYVVVHHDKLPELPAVKEIISVYPALKIKYGDDKTTVFFIEESTLPENSLPLSTNPARLQFQLLNVTVPSQVRAGSSFSVLLRVRNTGDTVWLSDTYDSSPPGRGEVRLGLREWIRVNGDVKSSVIADGRGKLPRDIWPGEEVNFLMSVTAPTVPGNYYARVNLVDELIQWFPQEPIDIAVSVTE